MRSALYNSMNSAVLPSGRRNGRYMISLITSGVCRLLGPSRSPRGVEVINVAWDTAPMSRKLAVASAAVLRLAEARPK